MQVSSSGKGVLITGCESPIAWYLAKKLDDVGFTVYAGFTHSPDNSEEGKVLKEETSGRLHILHLDVTSEKRVSTRSNTHQTNQSLFESLQSFLSLFLSLLGFFKSYWKRHFLLPSICHTELQGVEVSGLWSTVPIGWL